MPTKRWRRRRERVTEITLDDAVIETLLLGWGATTGRSAHADDLFFGNDAACARLWRAYALVLRAEAGRRGIAPAWPCDEPEMYFAEYCAFKEATCQQNG